ncbi:heme-binding protein [Bradyrhizobium sp. USDA 3458]|uniref:GlcG/HbpS family heme-binding protein n=1 Tax=Bradyrhizobium sp. USDA 3458 TaxID=2591461 RepID=UPI00190FB937|nr:heme-binding protein [Bradyrhizobium sp. USDA 3458]
MTRQMLAAAMLMACLPTLSVAEGSTSKPILTYNAAEEMIAACFAAQAAAGYAKVNVVVVDDGGRLIAAARQDGACKACTDIAQNKAITSSLYAAPTRTFADLSFGVKRDGVNAGLPGAAFVPGLVAFAGGLPIKTATGDVVGGIGVSGGSEDQDESCAQAGLNAVSKSLN